MDRPLASLIISVYDRVDFLEVVLDSVRLQTEKRFEVIISEDAERPAMREFLQRYAYEGDLYHLTQADTGWRKNRALNRAVQFSHADLLVFIDGDCVLHPRFMEMHIGRAEDKAILAGKRIKLDPESTRWLMADKGHIPGFQRHLARHWFRMRRAGCRFLEEGFFIDPQGPLRWVPRLRRMHQLKGCNMSFSKQAVIAINGFDKDYVRPAIGEDIDLTWRFQRAGYTVKSVRNLAVQYHLHHKETWADQDENLQLMLAKQAADLYVCRHGLSQT